MRRNWMFQKRLEKGLSQQDLADECSVSNRTISSIETGKRSPSGPLALKLSKVLDCDMSLFFLDEEKEGNKKSA